MGSRVRIRLFHILHFVRDLLFPLLKNSKSGVDDRSHRFRSGSPLTNYPHDRATPGDSHILVAPAQGLPQRVLNQGKSSIILKKGAIFALSFEQMSSGSFHMFIYDRSEQYDLCPIYTTINTQRIRVYPGILKFILVKISPDPGGLHGKHAKENQTLFTFLTTENLSGLPCSHECK